MYSISLEWISHHSLAVSAPVLFLHTTCSLLLRLRLFEEYRKKVEREKTDKEKENTERKGREGEERE